jgi:phosphoribosylformylglycinamidine synthase
MKTDCNSKFVYLDPRKGTQIAVAECARNITCTGGTPLGVTNCLNFGNPYKPEMYWQFKESVMGMGEACRVFGTPVTGGNVSFYNENPETAVFPTPVIGMVGMIEDSAHITTSNFKDNNDIILIIGAETKGEIGGSEYLSCIHKLVTGKVPDIDLRFEVRLQESLRDIIKGGLIKSAHDISDGGLAVALSECCIGDPEKSIGAKIRLPMNGLRGDRLIFSEDQSRIVITAERRNVENIIKTLRKKNMLCKEIGIVGGSIFEIEGIIMLSVDTMKEKYYSAIESIMER